MKDTFYFKKIKILKNSTTGIKKDAVLIIKGEIDSFGKDADKKAMENNIKATESGNKLIAPLLVDTHSILENPLSGFEDDLIRLKKRAKKSGFGTIALLPNSSNWRDNPEKIPYQKYSKNDLNIFFWGSFTLNDDGLFLSPQDDLLSSGVIGLSSTCFDDLSILFKGLELDLLDSFPLLISKKNNTEDAFVERDINSLQAGLHIRNGFHTKINAKKILELKNYFPHKKIIYKNIFDLQTIKELQLSKERIFSTISWWNLIADTNNLKMNDIGWKNDPPIVKPQTREELINSLENNFIDAIAVNSRPLSDIDVFTAINQRKSGISAFELVLPLLWDELVTKRSWDASKLWRHLSFIPSKLLGIPEEKISVGTRRWLMFDPDITWKNTQSNLGYDSPSNIPKKDQLIKGFITSYGLEL